MFDETEVRDAVAMSVYAAAGPKTIREYADAAAGPPATFDAHSLEKISVAVAKSIEEENENMVASWLVEELMDLAQALLPKALDKDNAVIVLSGVPVSRTAVRDLLYDEIIRRDSDEGRWCR